MRVVRDEPFEIQPRANAAMARALQVAAGLLFALALAGVLLPDPVGSVAGWTTVAVLVGAALGRVGWLAARWLQRGERLFAGLAVVLLLVVVLGGVLAR